jgi:condensin complex subunit 3
VKWWLGHPVETEFKSLLKKWWKMPSVAQNNTQATKTLTPCATVVLQSLDECQRSFASHRKCVLRLKKVQSANPKEFKEAVTSAIDRALLVFKREPCVERLFQFITDFVSFSNETVHADTDLAVEFIRHLIPLSRARDKAVRFRACQLISKLLNR